MFRLDDAGMETEIGWAGISIVRNILWNYSDASLRMGKAIGQCGLLRRFVRDLRNVGTTAIKNEVTLSIPNIQPTCIF